MLSEINELIGALERFKDLSNHVEEAGQALIKALQAGRKILTAGNGGSAADATHLNEELVARFLSNRRSLPSVCLSSDGALLTCIGNDFGFNQLFSRQIEGLGNTGDALVVFSTSGNSENLIHAVQTAKNRNLVTIALLGKDGGKIKGLSDLEIIVPSQTTARIQEIHTLVLHHWMNMIERVFSGKGSNETAI